MQKLEKKYDYSDMPGQKYDYSDMPEIETIERQPAEQPTELTSELPELDTFEQMPTTVEPVSTVVAQPTSIKPLTESEEDLRQRYTEVNLKYVKSYNQYESDKVDWVRVQATAVMPRVRKGERKAYGKLIDSLHKEYEEKAMFERVRIGELSGEREELRKKLGMDKGFQKAFDKYFPYVEAASGIAILLYGGIEGLKSVRDLYNLARIGKVVTKISKPDRDRLFEQLQKGNYPDWMLKMTGKERGEVFRRGGREEYGVRPFFRKLENLFRKTKLEEPGIKIPPAGLISARAESIPIKKGRIELAKARKIAQEIEREFPLSKFTAVRPEPLTTPRERGRAELAEAGEIAREIKLLRRPTVTKITKPVSKEAKKITREAIKKAEKAKVFVGKKPPKKAQKPITYLTLISRYGGLKAEGDLAGEVNRLPASARNKRGLTLDRMWERLHEEGYEVPTVNDLIEKLASGAEVEIREDREFVERIPLTIEREAEVAEKFEQKPITPEKLSMGAKVKIKGEEHTVIEKTVGGVRLEDGGPDVLVDKGDTILVDKGKIVVGRVVPKKVKVYHGTTKQFDPSNIKSGWFTDDIEEALKWGDDFTGKPTVITVNLELKNSINLSVDERGKAHGILKNKQQYIKQGYDGIVFNTGTSKHYMPFDYDKIRKQLEKPKPKVVKVLKKPTEVVTKIYDPEVIKQKLLKFEAPQAGINVKGATREQKRALVDAGMSLQEIARGKLVVTLSQAKRSEILREKVLKRMKQPTISFFDKNQAERTGQLINRTDKGAKILYNKEEIFVPNERLKERVEAKELWEMTRDNFETNPPKSFYLKKLGKEDIAQAMPDGRIAIDPDNFFGHSQDVKKDVIEHERAHFVENIISPKIKAKLFDNKTVMGYRGRNINEKLANMIQDGKSLPTEVLKEYPGLAKPSTVKVKGAKHEQIVSKELLGQAKMPRGKIKPKVVRIKPFIGKEGVSLAKREEPGTEDLFKGVKDSGLEWSEGLIGDLTGEPIKRTEEAALTNALASVDKNVLKDYFKKDVIDYEKKQAFERFLNAMGFKREAYSQNKLFERARRIYGKAKQYEEKISSEIDKLIKKPTKAKVIRISKVGVRAQVAEEKVPYVRRISTLSVKEIKLSDLKVGDRYIDAEKNEVYTVIKKNPVTKKNPVETVDIQDGKQRTLKGTTPREIRGAVNGPETTFSGMQIHPKKGKQLRIVRRKIQPSEVPVKALSGFKNFIDLKKIKTKKVPFAQMDIAGIVKGDKVYAAIRRSGFYARKEIQTSPVRNIYKQTMAPYHMALMQDGYKRGGKFGAIFRNMWLPTEEAVKNEKEFIALQAKSIRDLAKEHKIKATKRNLRHLSDVMEDKVEATPQEELFTKNLRQHLDDLRKQANYVRDMMGKDRIGYIEDYVPHLQKTSLWNQLLTNEATISDNLDFIIPNQVKNPFSFKRMMEEMPKAERNLFTLLDRYVKAIAKDIYITPAIENIKAYNRVLKNRELINASKYWDEYIRTGLIGKQHKLDTALSIGFKGRRALQKWNHMVNLAFLTGKVAWNVGTQPLSYMMNVPMEAGIRNSIKGIFKSYLNRPLRKYVKENSNVLQIKGSDVHSIAIGEGRNIQNRIYRTKIDKYNHFISMLSAIEERELTLASYIAGLDKAKNLGYAGKDALTFADLTAARSQSMYNKENRALILNSDIARTLFPFNSFNIEMFNHLKEITTKARGAESLNYRQRFGKLFGLLVGLYLSSLYSKALTGRKKTTPGTFIPFLGNYIDILIPKTFQAVKEIDVELPEKIQETIDKWSKERYYGRSPITVMQISEDILKGARDFFKYGNLRRLRKIGINFGLALGGIGGGGQLNNIIDGLIAGIEEDVKNVEGDVLFKVEDAESKVKAPIFGVWATKEGIEYWQPKEKKKPTVKILKPKKPMKPMKRKVVK